MINLNEEMIDFTLKISSNTEIWYDYFSISTIAPDVIYSNLIINEENNGLHEPGELINYTLTITNKLHGGYRPFPYPTSNHFVVNKNERRITNKDFNRTNDTETNRYL